MPGNFARELAADLTRIEDEYFAPQRRIKRARIALLSHVMETAHACGWRLSLEVLGLLKGEWYAHQDVDALVDASVLDPVCLTWYRIDNTRSRAFDTVPALIDWIDAGCPDE